MKLVHIAGTRPNFVKIASIIRACNATDEIESVLVHTGQHYSDNMSKRFFRDLDIPLPDINLEVGSGSHAAQTAEIMKRFEKVVIEQKPDAVLVVGDVNSTLACVLVSKKMQIETIHVEAGLRSFDRTMPEEINRVLTDAISDILFVSEPSGLMNLRNEGISSSRIYFVGNVMIDTLEANKSKAESSTILNDLDLRRNGYSVLTLHRPANVDDGNVFKEIVDALAKIQEEIKVVFPIHPRTRQNLESNSLGQRLKALPNILLIEPLGYLDFLKLMSNSKIVLTDSGGIQEESTILGIPCLTLRENTERPITIHEGTNILVGMGAAGIFNGYKKSMCTNKSYRRPKLWDGKASERIAKVLLNLFVNISSAVNYA